MQLAFGRPTALSDLGPVSGAVEGQTLEYCHSHDFVCSIGIGA